MKTFLLCFVSIFVLSFSAEASAQNEVSSNEEGYGYVFDDDPLQAGGIGPNDSKIRVRPMAARVTLIRPRTSFIYEMLKSIENI